ncbi:hypothetical protein BJX64DRAFT_283925 [Aspergillus heterothallicus]
MSTSLSNADAQRFYQSFQVDIARALLGLDCVFAVVTFGLGVYALVLKRRRDERFNFAQLPQWTVIAFLWTNFLYGTFISIRMGLMIGGPSELTGSLQDYYYVGDILPFFFLYGGMCVLIYILYYLLHLVLAGCPKMETPSTRVTKVHWYLVGLASAMTAVEWGLQTKNQLLSLSNLPGADQSADESYIKAYAGFDLATFLVRLGISIEILTKLIQLCLKTVGKRSRWRSLAILLSLTTTFFLAINLMWVIWDIRWRIMPLFTGEVLGASYQNGYYATYICLVVFYLVVYVTLVPFCLRWGWLAKRDEREQAEKEEKEEIERAALPPEADSKPRQVVEADGREMGYEVDSAPVNEADSVPLAEMDAAREKKRVEPPVELDSMEVGK